MTTTKCDLHEQSKLALYTVTFWDIDVCEECRNILRIDEGIPNYCFVEVE